MQGKHPLQTIIGIHLKECPRSYADGGRQVRILHNTRCCNSLAVFHSATVTRLWEGGASVPEA